jgi:D-glycero-D-manno-heptose 1,7-bisphosphate phosphatase
VNTKNYELIIYDIDGTLTETKSGAKFRRSADDWQWLPGRLEKIEALREQDIKQATASNQGGIAFGYMPESEMFAAMLDLGNQGQFDTMRVCYQHPTATIDRYREDSPLRKPGPGMLLEIMQELEVSADKTLMVGDRPEDQQAAQTAGVGFIWADDFFSEEEECS